MATPNHTITKLALAILAVFTIVLTAADAWTTYLCLAHPHAGWSVSEANPFSDWLFQQVGLVPGLVLDGVVTFVAVLFMVSTRLLPSSAKILMLLTFVGVTGYAVVNNLGIVKMLGMTPLG